MQLTKDQGDALVLGACVVAFVGLLLGLIVGLPWLARVERIDCIERNVKAGVTTYEQAQELCK